MQTLEQTNTQTIMETFKYTKKHLLPYGYAVAVSLADDENGFTSKTIYDLEGRLLYYATNQDGSTETHIDELTTF